MSDSQYIAELVEIYAALSDDSIRKVAFIDKENGSFVVKSRKGKSLGKFKSKAEARKRLRQIEMFKHMRDKNDAHDETVIEDGKPVTRLVSHGE